MLNKSSPKRVDSPPVNTTVFNFDFALNESMKRFIKRYDSFSFHEGLDIIRQCSHLILHWSVVAIAVSLIFESISI